MKQQYLSSLNDVMQIYCYFCFTISRTLLSSSYFRNVSIKITKLSTLLYEWRENDNKSCSENTHDDDDDLNQLNKFSVLLQ